MALPSWEKRSRHAAPGRAFFGDDAVSDPRPQCTNRLQPLDRAGDEMPARGMWLPGSVNQNRVLGKPGLRKVQPISLGEDGLVRFAQKRARFPGRSVGACGENELKLFLCSAQQRRERARKRRRRLVHSCSYRPQRVILCRSALPNPVSEQRPGSSLRQSARRRDPPKSACRRLLQQPASLLYAIRSLCPYGSVHVGILLCSKQYFAGSRYCVEPLPLLVFPVVGSTHGHGCVPKNAGFDER
jgi:hypothetical protein